MDSTTDIPKEVQAVVEDPPFEGHDLLNLRTEEALHCLKDSRETLLSLGIYTPTQKRKQNRSQSFPRQRYLSSLCHYQ